MGEKFEPLTSTALIIVQVQSIAGKNEMWKWARKQNKKILYCHYEDQL